MNNKTIETIYYPDGLKYKCKTTNRMSNGKGTSTCNNNVIYVGDKIDDKKWKRKI